MEKVIESVEVIHQCENGPDTYKVGGTCGFGGPVIADITENYGRFLFYNTNDELIMEIRNCPVVVRYKDDESERNGE